LSLNWVGRREDLGKLVHTRIGMRNRKLRRIKELINLMYLLKDFSGLTNGH